jgi:uncharacterized protein involved in response to NO
LIVRKGPVAATAYDRPMRDAIPRRPAKPIPFIVLHEPAAKAPQPRGFALWQLGFRPFYLLAGVFGAASIALWAAQVSGALGATYLPAPVWHAHEMLFGFALAVIVGFLFTAGGNWSGRPTPRGAPLAALAVLWLAARCVALTPYGWIGAVVGPAFALAAAIGLAIPLRAARNRRNYVFVALLVAFAVLDLVFHLAALGAIAMPEFFGVRLGLDIVLFVMALMSGRVLPMFTNNAIAGAGAERRPRLEAFALGAILALAVADLAGVEGSPLAVVAFAAAALHALRWSLWRPWKTLRTPIVWILHAATLWIPIHLALRGAASLGWVASTAASHALTVGALGGLVLGMMTRTARGHTGRPLRADSFDVASYALVSLAAVVRVVLPIVQPEATMTAIVASATLWSAAFAIFSLRYWPVLTRPRLDGAPG